MDWGGGMPAAVNQTQHVSHSAHDIWPEISGLTIVCAYGYNTQRSLNTRLLQPGYEFITDGAGVSVDEGSPG